MTFYFNFASKDGFDKDLKEYLSPDQIEFDDVFGNHFVWEVAGEMDYQFSEHTFCGRFKIDEIDDVTNDYHLGTSYSNESVAEILKNIEPSSLKFNVVDGNHELDYDFFEGSFEWGNDFRVELKKGEKTLNVLEDWSEFAENLSDTTPDKIYKDYDNTPVSVAVLPDRAKNLFDGIHDWNIYCGKAYFIDNVKNHHPELSADVFEDFQYNLDNFEKVFYDQKTRSIILCVKDNKKNYDLVIKPDMQNRILFCKYQNTAKHSKERYVEIDLDKLDKKLSVEGGNPSINHPDSEEPGLGRLLSALTDRLSVDDKSSAVKSYKEMTEADLKKVLENYPSTDEIIKDILFDFNFYQIPLVMDSEGNIFQHDKLDAGEEEYQLLTIEGIFDQEKCWNEDRVLSTDDNAEIKRLEGKIKWLEELKDVAKYNENHGEYIPATSNDLSEYLILYPQISEELLDNMIKDFKFAENELVKDSSGRIFRTVNEETYHAYHEFPVEDIIPYARDMNSDWLTTFKNTSSSEENEIEIRDRESYKEELDELMLYTEDPRRYYKLKYYDALQKCRKEVESEEKGLTPFQIEERAEQLFEETANFDEVPGYYVAHYGDKYFEQWKENLENSSKNTVAEADIDALITRLHDFEDIIDSKKSEHLWHNLPEFRELNQKEKIDIVKEELLEHYIAFDDEKKLDSLAEEIVVRITEDFDLERSDPYWYVIQNDFKYAEKADKSWNLRGFHHRKQRENHSILKGGTPFEKNLCFFVCHRIPMDTPPMFCRNFRLSHGCGCPRCQPGHYQKHTGDRTGYCPRYLEHGSVSEWLF